MNTNPDEAKLALWLEDELHGDELKSFEQWILTQPEHIAAREEVRHWKQMISATLPESEEPPYPDFFNSRIMQAISQPVTAAPPISTPKATPFWKSWLMPASAFAGMALAFWVGTQTSHTEVRQTASAPSKTEFQPIVYTPDGEVNAVWTSGADASVIVLEGVNPIPDATDFTETVYMDTDHEIDSTAGRDSLPH